MIVSLSCKELWMSKISQLDDGSGQRNKLPKRLISLAEKKRKVTTAKSRYWIKACLAIVTSMIKQPQIGTCHIQSFLIVENWIRGWNSWFCAILSRGSGVRYWSTGSNIMLCTTNMGSQEHFVLVHICVPYFSLSSFVPFLSFFSGFQVRQFLGQLRKRWRAAEFHDILFWDRYVFRGGQDEGKREKRHLTIPCPMIFPSAGDLASALSWT